ncbi:MAG: hypothetical protein EON96_15605 [Caulobacteraceae bacterium]|nr:MAG: hypothetical protein EON96_15605 [Caulobacteraceae bacterium]
MRLPALTVTLASVFALASCASLGGAPEAPAGPPTVIRAAGEPAPPQARFYADCIAAAAIAGTYDKEASANLLRFTCTGAPARAFYDGLAAWSATSGSEVVAEGRTWRYTQKIKANPFGLDDCSSDSVGDFRCTVTLNVGEFLSAS